MCEFLDCLFFSLSSINKLLKSRLKLKKKREMKEMKRRKSETLLIKWAAIFVSFFFIISLFFFITPNLPQPELKRGFVHNIPTEVPKKISTEKCPRVKLYPSSGGCPLDCSKCNKGEKGEDLTNLNLGLNLAHLGGILDGMGVTLRFSAKFIDDFLRFAMTLSSQVYSQEKQFSRSNGAILFNYEMLKPILSNRLHITLEHFCCLNKTEVDIVSKIGREWFGKSIVTVLELEKLACFEERNNQVGVFLLLNEKTQIKLREVQRELRESIKKEGISNCLNTDEQMPFHFRMMSYRYGERISTDDEMDVGYVSPIVNQIVKENSEKIVNTLSENTKFEIRLAPELFVPED